MAAMWMVRAGRGFENLESFLSEGVVAIGDTAVGKLPEDIDKAQMLKLWEKGFLNVAPATRVTWASQCLRFLQDLEIGDEVLTYDGDQRLYHLGKITSGYEWHPEIIEDKAHIRRVAWTHVVARDQLSSGARNTLGAIQTLFKIAPPVADELRRTKVEINAAGQPAAPPPKVTPAKPSAEEGQSEAEIGEEILEKADGFIEDCIARLDWEQMQDLVAGILRAMGYQTRVSPRGSDRGVDIFASPDGLGLQEPRIFVQVKHRAGAMGADELRSFLGGRKPGEKLLYVSSGGFTKEAYYEAERASVALTLVNLAQMRGLLVEHYDRVDAEVRTLVPLRRFYWPVA